MKKYSICKLAGVAMIFGASSLLGCGHKPPLKIEQLDSLPAVIFIPGYYGTSLRDKATGERVFVTASKFLFGNESLALHNDTLATPKASDLVADEVLGGVRLIPGLYTYDIYQDFIGGLTHETKGSGKSQAVQILPFAYDWREDLPTAAAGLHKLVEELKSKGVSRIDIVAHSMGGLVATYYLAYGNQNIGKAVLNGAGAKNIRKLVLIGTPFTGVFSIFRNMQTGAPLSGNKKLLPAEAVASFPASYQISPYGSAKAFDFYGKEMNLPIESFEYWNNQKLGLLKNTEVTPPIRKNREEFVLSELARAVRFSKMTKLPAAETKNIFSELKILSIVGTGTKTVNTAYYDPKVGFVFDNQSDELKKHKLEKDKLYVDGDGTVPLASAQLPEAFAARAEIIKSKVGHQNLGNDKAVMKRIGEFLRE